MNCKPDCTICAGAGWYRQDLPVHHKDFGKLLPCPNAKADHLVSGDSRYGLDADEIAELSFDLIRPGISAGDKAATVVQDAMAQGFGLVYLWGGPGQAKTLALKAAVATSLRAGKIATYANMAAILDDLRLAFDDPERKTTELLRRMEFWINMPVLAIDEIDKTNRTDWAEERLHQLIDMRWAQAIREQSLTLVAANTAAGRLGMYLGSRFEDARFARFMVHLDGKDGRKAMPEGHRW